MFGVWYKWGGAYRRRWVISNFGSKMKGLSERGLYRKGGLSRAFTVSTCLLALAFTYKVCLEKASHDVRGTETNGVPKGGDWGSGPPHFSKSWSARFAQKCNKIGGGGGRADLSRSGFEKQAKNVFQLVVRFWSLRNV